ncbi:MAG TPA: CopG family transcriptional regulator [Polyangia bacterium]
MEKQNVTISLPKDILRRARHLAVERGTSLSGLLAEFVDRVVREDEQYVAATRRIKRRLKQGIDLGTKGTITWSRDELHER